MRQTHLYASGAFTQIQTGMIARCRGRCCPGRTVEVRAGTPSLGGITMIERYVLDLEEVGSTDAFRSYQALTPARSPACPFLPGPPRDEPAS